MVRLGFLFALVFAVPSFGLFAVGDIPTNYCWKDATDTRFCLEDPSLQYQVRVLMYNAGWCGPCNSEFSDFNRYTDEFENKMVTFISLSSDGWSQGSSAGPKFLKEWISKHDLDKAKASLIVAGSPRDAGRDFFSDTYIPNIVIIDMNGEVAYKAINPGLAKVAAEVKKLLPRPVPCSRALLREEIPQQIRDRCE